MYVYFVNVEQLTGCKWCKCYTFLCIFNSTLKWFPYFCFEQRQKQVELFSNWRSEDTLEIIGPRAWIVSHVNSAEERSRRVNSTHFGVKSKISHERVTFTSGIFCEYMSVNSTYIKWVWSYFYVYLYVKSLTFCDFCSWARHQDYEAWQEVFFLFSTVLGLFWNILTH